MTQRLESGSNFGDYLLEQWLGGGGFGDVWSARSSSGERVALKILKDAGASEAVKLRAEIEMVSVPDSRHVVRVLGGGEEPSPHIVMEYIEGIDLARDVSQRGSLPVHEVVRVAEAVAEALVALQHHGIIHRDIKPSNVMIDSRGVIKLTDFGVAKVVGLDGVTSLGQTAMSLSYAAPELWLGETSYLTDYYAYGAMLYACLTGRPPFGGSTPEIYQHHLNTTPDLGALPATTPPALRQLIAGCLAKDPAQRPASATDLRSAAALAQTELMAADSAVRRQQKLSPPPALGPWIIERRLADGEWTFVCQHQSSGDQALVDLHFTDQVDDGASLRLAVAVNSNLVPLGGERLLGTSRLMLRPNQGWPDQPAGRIMFWVAREGLPAAAPPASVTRQELAEARASLEAFIVAATSNGLSLSLRPSDLSLLPGGRVRVLRPGLPPYSGMDPFRSAEAFLASLPLEPDATVLEPLPIPPVPEPQPQPEPPLPEPEESQHLPSTTAADDKPKLVALPGSGDSKRPPLAASADKPMPGETRRRPSATLLAKLGAGIAAVALAAVIVPSAFGGGGESMPLVPTPGAEAPKPDPTPVAAFYNKRGDEHLSATRYTEAVAEYTKALELEPRNATFYYGRGRANRGAGLDDAALADYTRAIELNPQYAFAYNSRGFIHRTRGSHELALADFTKAIEINRNFAAAYNNRALTYGDTDKKDLAIADYTRVIELEPRNAAAYHNRGVSYFKLGNRDRALVDFDKAIELDSTQAAFFRWRADLHSAARRDNEALADYTRAIEFNPRDEQAYNSRGVIHADARRFAEALADYNQAIELNPSWAKPYLNRGIVHQTQGRRDPARADYETARSLATTAEDRGKAETGLNSLR